VRRLGWLAVLLVACSAQPSTSAGSPGASPSATTCKLAVIAGTHGQGSGPQQAGFLSLPGSTFAPAPGAGDGMFYDRPLKRWVPAGPPALAANGLAYAFVDGDTRVSRLHLVDLITGGDVVLASGGPWRVAGVEPDAVYVMLIEYMETQAYGELPIGHGLWRVPRAGGPPVELTRDSRGWEVLGGAAWGGGSTLDVAGGPNDIVRLDLSTGKVKTWFAPGKRSFVIAVDRGGAPIVMAEAADRSMWRVASPGNAVKVWSGTVDGLGPDYPVATDGDVIWFSSRSGTPTWAIYRYSPDLGLQQAAVFTDHPVSVAGPCA
jgi:hypothetical protein